MPNKITAINIEGREVSVAFELDSTPFDLSLVWGVLMMKVNKRFSRYTTTRLKILITVGYAVREFNTSRYPQSMKMHNRLFLEIDAIDNMIHRASNYDWNYVGNSINSHIPPPLF